MLARPFLDRIIFTQDRPEIEQIQELEKRLFTTTDLQQLLENILAAMCDLLRVSQGFVAARTAEGWQIQATTDDPESARQLLRTIEPAALAEGPAKTGGASRLGITGSTPIWQWRGDAARRARRLGARRQPGVRAAPDSLQATKWTEREQDLAEALVTQAELALPTGHSNRAFFRRSSRSTPRLRFYSGRAASRAMPGPWRRNEWRRSWFLP